MSSADTQFSKVRLEMLCDGIFAIAMTLLVLELKPPDLPRQAASAEILHALRVHGLVFVGFMLAILLAAQWLMASRQGLLTESDRSRKRRRSELMISLQPLTFAVAMVTIFIAPRQALFSAATTQIAIALATKRLAARR